MPAAPLPVDEGARLAALRRLGILDTPREERYDRLVRLASATLGMPIALVSLVDGRRQWFKARVGLDVQETTRELAFCAHAILSPHEQLVVRDATRDERFADNPLVTQEPRIRFYAGQPLAAPDGHPVGTLCVIDRVPREFGDRDRQVLADLARLVEQELAHADRDDLLVELERSERSKAILLDTLTDGLVVQDAGGRIVEWNRAATELLGLCDDELAGRTSIDPRWRSVHPDGSPWPGEDHPAMETLRTGEPVSDRTMGVHRPDGSLVWLSVTSSPIRDRDGAVTSALTLFGDLAARFDSARASETMALRLRQAIESSGIGTAILDRRGATMFVNDAFTEILGRQHRDLLGRPPTIWIHPDDPQFGGRPFASLVRSDGHRLTTEIRVADDGGRDDGARWVRAHLTRVGDDASADRYVLQLEDVTEQRRLEQALLHSEQVASASLDVLSHGVVLADATGAIHRINPAAVEILGYESEALTHAFRHGPWETYDEHGRVLAPHERPLQRTIEHAETVRNELVGWLRSDGHLVLLRLSCIPLPDVPGEPRRFVVAFADVTEQRRAERVVDATFAAAPVGLALVDLERSIVRSNTTFAEHAERDRRSGAILDVPSLVAPGGADDGPLRGDELHLDVGADESWIERRITRIDDFERPMHVVATFDITARKRLEQDLERFRHLFRHSNDIITVVDRDGQVLYASPSNERVLGYPDGWRSPGGVLDMVHPDDLEAAVAEFGALLDGSRGPEPFTMRVRHHDGTYRFIETVGTNLLDEPSVRGVVLTSRDVTERQQLSEQLAHRAAHDPLTDLPNRAAARDRIESSLDRARAAGSPIGVCYVDLDGFKQVNDTLGHAAGDAVLVDVAERLRRAVRGTDLAARLGGDEFVVVLESVGDEQRAVDIACRLHDRLVVPHLRAGDLDVGASMGVAVSRPDDTVDTLLSRADAALYRAKARRHAEDPEACLADVVVAASSS